MLIIGMLVADMAFHYILCEKNRDQPKAMLIC